MKRTVKAWTVLCPVKRCPCRTWPLDQSVAAFAYSPEAIPCSITYDDGRPARRRKGGKK